MKPAFAGLLPLLLLGLIATAACQTLEQLAEAGTAAADSARDLALASGAASAASDEAATAAYNTVTAGNTAGTDLSCLAQLDLTGNGTQSDSCTGLAASVAANGTMTCPQLCTDYLSALDTQCRATVVTSPSLGDAYKEVFDACNIQYNGSVDGDASAAEDLGIASSPVEMQAATVPGPSSAVAASPATATATAAPAGDNLLAPAVAPGAAVAPEAAAATPAAAVPSSAAATSTAVTATAPAPQAAGLAVSAAGLVPIAAAAFAAALLL